jgi:hypothetical protein
MGKHKYIETPEKLLSMWDEYKTHVDSTPDKIEQATPKGDIVSLKVKKPYLRSGFEAFVFRVYGFNVHQYLDNNDGLYDEYMRVVMCIKKEWESDQISGTMTGRYKAPNLTARLNNLTEKTDITTNGQSINKISVEIILPNNEES